VGPVWLIVRTGLVASTTAQAVSAIRFPIRTRLKAVTANSAQSWLRRVPT
jgi:hypothetical protein